MQGALHELLPYPLATQGDTAARAEETVYSDGLVSRLLLCGRSLHAVRGAGDEEAPLLINL